MDLTGERGYLLGELIRRVDGRRLGQFFAEEIAAPLGLEFWIGLPESEESRVAPMVGSLTPESGDVGFHAPQGWLDGADPIEIARQLYPDASRRLLVFGSTKAGGWDRRIWLKSPSIR